MHELGLANLGTVVTYNPWAVSTDTSLVEMVGMCIEAEFHHWPVVDSDHQLIGIVSEIDVVRALEEHAAAVAYRSDRPQDRLGELQQCSVQDFMTRRPVSVDHRASLATALRLLSEHGVKSLPVLEDKRLVGLITSSDALREFSYGDWPGGSEPVTDALDPIADPIESDASLDDAAAALQLTSADHLGVVRADFPLGVISGQDVRLARCLATTKQYLEQDPSLTGPTTIRELVASAPILRPGAALVEAATVLVQNRRRAAAVINQAGRLLGAVTESGILTRLTKHLCNHSLLGKP